jgi:uncharacterized protein YqhQ
MHGVVLLVINLSLFFIDPQSKIIYIYIYILIRSIIYLLIKVYIYQSSIVKKIISKFSYHNSFHILYNINARNDLFDLLSVGV